MTHEEFDKIMKKFGIRNYNWNNQLETIEYDYGRKREFISRGQTVVFDLNPGVSSLKQIRKFLNYLYRKGVLV